MSAPEEPKPATRDRQAPVLSTRVILACAGALVLLAAAATWLLLGLLGDGSEASKVRLDAIRTVGTIMLGTGGLVALLLTARRQQTAERDLVEKRRDLILKERAQQHTEKVQQHAEKQAADMLAYQLRVAEATESDASARRITELFDTAVGKLGSDKAAVRLGALYALERLAEHAPDQQRAITHVLCAYLRMPYSDYSTSPIKTDDQLAGSELQYNREERGVRLAIQRLLAEHLQPRHRSEGFWPKVAIDLAGATLIDFNLIGCELSDGVDFSGATFIGQTNLNNTQFLGEAHFASAKFTGVAIFDEIKVSETANFSAVRFENAATFARARFKSVTWFGDAHFASTARFTSARFLDVAMFTSTKFESSARFDSAIFRDDAWFDSSKFAGVASFEASEFRQEVRFDSSEFLAIARYQYVEFAKSAWFDSARFAGEVDFSNTKFSSTENLYRRVTFHGKATFPALMDIELANARARIFKNQDSRITHSWPSPWHVVPDESDPTYGRLERQTDNQTN